MNNKIDIYLQLFHTDLWDEFQYYILSNQLSYNNIYIALTMGQDNRHILNDTKNLNNCYIDIIPNKGGDIGAFLCQFKKYSNNSKALNFIKIHSKKSIMNLSNSSIIMDPNNVLPPQLWWPQAFNWRSDILYKLMGTKEIFEQNISFMINSNVGMVFPYYHDFDENNNNYLIEELLKNIFSINYDTVRNTMFPAGSMFMSKTNIFKHYFTPSTIDRLYDNMPFGVIIDNGQGSICHALERILGYIVTSFGLRIRPI